MDRAASPPGNESDGPWQKAVAHDLRGDGDDQIGEREVEDDGQDLRARPARRRIEERRYPKEDDEEHQPHAPADRGHDAQDTRRPSDAADASLD